MNIDIKLNQKMSLTPQIRQSMEILQMGSQELLEYIGQLTVENPVVEVEESYSESDKHELLRKKLEWLDSIDEENRVYYRESENSTDNENFNVSIYEEASENSLQYYLKSQLDFMKISYDERKAAEYIIGCIDEKGYLEVDIKNIAKVLGISVERTKDLLSLVQSLEPAGVGTRNLKECLSLQLKRKGVSDTVIYRIIDEHLEALSKNQLDIIAKKLSIAIDEVKNARKIIRSLNPRPGSSFNAQGKLQYVTPDLIVVKFSNYYEILLNDYYYPKVSISSYYRVMLGSTNDNEVKKYISHKIKEAEWILKCIDQRNSTLVSVARVIVDIQKQFFDTGPGNLVPMILKDVAERLGIHESTVSRAVREKYVQCSWGIYELSSFFSNGLHTEGETQVTPDAVKTRIKEIVNGENPKKPYSDQKITDILNEKGINISRRTVAKYREEMNIAGASGRKEY